MLHCLSTPPVGNGANILGTCGHRWSSSSLQLPLVHLTIRTAAAPGYPDTLSVCSMVGQVSTSCNIALTLDSWMVRWPYRQKILANWCLAFQRKNLASRGQIYGSCNHIDYVLCPATWIPWVIRIFKLTRNWVIAMTPLSFGLTWSMTISSIQLMLLMVLTILTFYVLIKEQ